MGEPHPDASAKIDAYIAGLPEPWRRTCARLRAIVRKAAPRLVEDWKWSTPCYCGDSIVCGFAAFKKHVTFDFFHGALIDDRHGIFNHGKGNARARGIKLLHGDPIPVEALTDCVRQAAKLDLERVGAAKKPARRRMVVVPAALTKLLSLKKHARARQFFESLPPSCRQEYCEWIASAKRRETVERRLRTALEQLSRGERMHEKYRA